MLLLSLIISLTLAFLYLSKKKMLSLRLYVLTKSENLIEKIIIFLIIFSVFSLLIYFISLKIKNFTDLNPVFAYVQNHYDHWKFTWTDVYKGVVRIESGSELLKIFNVENKFWNSDNNFYEMFNTIINNLFDKFKFILEPLPVNYSNEILANQIHDLSILLFILSVLITVLLIFLLFNIIILINMDKIIKIFKNKFILLYLKWNKKAISIEVFLLGGSILYFMFTLSKGLLFIATHPINF